MSDLTVKNQPRKGRGPSGGGVRAAYQAFRNDLAEQGRVEAEGMSPHEIVDEFERLGAWAVELDEERRRTWRRMMLLGIFLASEGDPPDTELVREFSGWFETDNYRHGLPRLGKYEVILELDEPRRLR